MSRWILIIILIHFGSSCYSVAAEQDDVEPDCVRLSESEVRTANWLIQTMLNTPERRVSSLGLLQDLISLDPKKAYHWYTWQQKLLRSGTIESRELYDAFVQIRTLQ